MDIETENKIIKAYNNYIHDKSIFASTAKILPSFPQSLTSFPTIIIKEVSNTLNLGSTTTNYQEHADNLTYQVDIYTKPITIGNVKYQSRNVISELVMLTCSFFMDSGFIRTNGSKNDYVDITVSRYTMIFTTTRNSWNGKIR